MTFAKWLSDKKSQLKNPKDKGFKDHAKNMFQRDFPRWLAIHKWNEQKKFLEKVERCRKSSVSIVNYSLHK